MKKLLKHLARKLTPLKVVGFAFRKDKGTFKSGSKENNSCAGSRERDGRGIGGSTFSNNELHKSLPFQQMQLQQSKKRRLFVSPFGSFLVFQSSYFRRVR